MSDCNVLTAGAVDRYMEVHKKETNETLDYDEAKMQVENFWRFAKVVLSPEKKSSEIK